MPKVDELRQLRQVFREAIKGLQLTPRQIEDALDIGHGSLSRLLDGKIELKVRHLLAIARLLDVHPREFLDNGFPDWKARHQLADWVPPALRKAKNTSPLSPELVEAIRTVVREEISRDTVPNASES